jgi:hypothetical protein
MPENCLRKTVKGRLSYLESRGEDIMYKNRRFKQLKNILSFESETDKEIRSDVGGKIIKNSARVFEHKQ